MPSQIINGQQLHYIDQGGGPVILFGHSFLWNTEMWRPQIDIFSEQYRCIAPDLWNHGLSADINNTEYTIAQIADDYAALLQMLNIDKCIVVGLSVGGMWGTQLAIAYPDLVSGLVIMDSYVGSEPQASQAEYLALLSAVEQNQEFSAELIEKIIPFFFSPKTLSMQTELVNNFRQHLTSIPTSRLPGILQLGRAIFCRESLLDKLPQFNLPSLVVVGEDDIPRPPSEAKQMQQLIPNAQLAIIPNAGHIANLEQIERVNKVLFDFLLITSKKHSTNWLKIMTQQYDLIIKGA